MHRLAAFCLLSTTLAGAAALIWKNWDTLGPKFFALIDTISTYFGNLKDRAIEAGRNRSRIQRIG